MVCINCGNNAQNNFCDRCGQRTHVKRITFKEGWNDFWSRMYGFDGMFPRTLRDLTVNPGIVIEKYLKGNRVLYYGPVGYFFLMITVYLLLMNLLDVDVRDFMDENRKVMTMPAGAGQQKFAEKILDLISGNLKVMAFVIVPFNAIAARYLLFRKSGFNYIEHMVPPFYISGHIHWLSCIAVIIYKITGSLIANSAVIFIMLIYYGFAYSTFMTNQSKWKSFLKGLSVQILGQIIMMIIAGVILATIIYFNHDIFEMLSPSNNK